KLFPALAKKICQSATVIWPSPFRSLRIGTAPVYSTIPLTVAPPFSVYVNARSPAKGVRYQAEPIDFDVPPAIVPPSSTPPVTPSPMLVDVSELVVQVPSGSNVLPVSIEAHPVVLSWPPADVIE